MPFQLKLHDDETTGLIAVCDVCGKSVTGEEANILWSSTQKDKRGATFYPFRIACRDRCTRAIDDDFGHQHFQNLDTAIGYLINNLKLDLKKVRRNMEVLSMIG
jgi:hypothetical protein